MQVWVFFYGSYMNFDVLREASYVPGRWEPARLRGFDIVIRPRANLARDDRHSVYGILATATHSELARLYTHARDVLGETYLPEAVLAETLDGKWRAALCYVAPDMAPRPAASDYIDRIVEPARKFGFPEWYIERLESFRPRS
jgi:hypothetical protein